MDQEEVTACDRCRERGEECQPGKQGARACAQCRQVKASCSLVKKRPAAPSTPPRARKRPRINEAGSSRAGRTQERAEVADGGAETEDAWGVRACEGIARLSDSLEGLTSMIGQQNELLGRLLDMMAKERVWAAWRRMEEAPRTVPVVLGEGEEEEVREEVEEGVGNEEENEEDGE